MYEKQKNNLNKKHEVRITIILIQIILLFSSTSTSTVGLKFLHASNHPKRVSLLRQKEHKLLMWAGRPLNYTYWRACNTNKHNHG